MVPCRSTTFSNRYTKEFLRCASIADLIYKYAKDRRLDAVKVIDVGCSEGIAIKECAEHLSKRGITLNTYGIDPEPAIRSSAEQNVGVLIPVSVMDVTASEYDCLASSDIVILSRVHLHYNARQDKLACVRSILKILVYLCRIDCITKLELNRKCCGFLKPEGILIIHNGGLGPFVKSKESVMNDTH